MTKGSLHTDLAPTGKLRVGINYGNPVLAKRDAATGELSGVAVDLARELARRADVPVVLIGFESAGKMFESVKNGVWDIAFLAIDPGRANEVDFTPPYVEIEGTYLVPADSEFRAVEDIDRAGVRIGVSAKSAYDLFLSRTIRHAELVRAASPDAAFELIASGKVDVLAGVRQHLAANATKLPGSRVFAGRFMAIQQALGVPKGRDVAAKYLREFIEDVKASGFVARAIARAGVRGVSVAPPAARRE
ncbi:MAG TPA: ABC transporter substrate-binding protein [Candidatus Binatia bacterium]|jgi:polar amino acid transport system substrate-binding protein